MQDYSSSPENLRFERWLALLLLAALAVRIPIVLIYEINWDEFYFLSFVHDFIAGRPMDALQTFHAHAFTWLPLVSENEAAQVVAARAVMLALQALTGWFLYKIARAFLSHEAGLFATLSYFSFSYVIWQGTSFRTDPIATCLLMGSIYIVLCRPMHPSYAVLTGSLLAVAAMVTIKSAIYVPTIGIILLAQWKEEGWSRKRFIYGAVAVVSTLGFLTGLYFWHKASLTELAPVLVILAHSYSKTVNFLNLFPQASYFEVTLLMDFCFWAAAFAGIFLTLAGKEKRTRRTMILAMAIPLLSLLFYRNAFPYYYVFILAPLAVFCGVTWDHARTRFKKGTRATILIVAIILCALNLFNHGILRTATKTLFYQKEILDVIHTAFPEPVFYIDRCSMVASFPKAGFFMSEWGIEDYHEDRKISLAEEIKHKKPRFRVANTQQRAYAPEYMLTEEDSEALRENYVPYWGPIYIAGKDLSGKTAFSIVIDGTYTVEGAPAVIDGVAYTPGNIVELATGGHSVSTSALAHVSLIWGQNLIRPEQPAPAKAVFNGF